MHLAVLSKMTLQPQLYVQYVCYYLVYYLDRPTVLERSEIRGHRLGTVASIINSNIMIL